MCFEKTDVRSGLWPHGGGGHQVETMRGWIEAEMKMFPVITLIPQLDVEPCGAQVSGAGVLTGGGISQEPCVVPQNERALAHRGPLLRRGQGAR